MFEKKSVVVVDRPKPKGDGDVQVQVEPIARRAVEALFFLPCASTGPDLQWANLFVSIFYLLRSACLSFIK